MASRWVSLLLLSLAFLVQTSHQVRYVSGSDPVTGRQLRLKDTRQPALFTRNFGDCLGSSIVNVTRFDAAYYRDNMTVLFHLQGSTNVNNETLMMHIGVFAYGESRFQLAFNPCNANIASLCPMKAGVPIEANGIIPIAPSDVAGIPPIALSIPDFEGQAILRIFANSTESEIGCYSGLVTNGQTMSHPAAVGTVLGLFTLLAVLASFASAIYGNQIPTTRKHYAHSMSVFVVFAVFHHIFFSGALSTNWPSVLPAFWSNFAWAGGMIYSEKMQNSINSFLGSNLGNTTSVGAASSGSPQKNLGGGVAIQSIYKRTLSGASDLGSQLLRTRSLEGALTKRTLANSSEGYDWYGQPVKPGMPLPGNFSGFAGTLSVESIPASNAFMTGLLWLLILISLIAFAVVAVKWILEGLSRTHFMRNDRFTFFRAHWIAFTILAVLRTLFIAFFMMMFLTLFQSSYKGSAGVTAIAAIIFVLFFVGTLAIAGYACFYRLRHGHYETDKDRLHLERRKVLRRIPWYGFVRDSQVAEKGGHQIFAGSLPWLKIDYISHDPQRATVHEDEDYIKKFGWLASRFRRTRWWFFAVWLIYEFIRACFYGGAASNPQAQLYGLLFVEIIAFIALLVLKPFESTRLNALVVYLLGFSKVATVAISIAFETRYNLPRILTTVLGVIIIVIQGILTILLLVAIVIGALSTYASITRNREEFRPKGWTVRRDKFLAHVDKRAADLPPPPPEEPRAPTEPYFNVSAVRRCPKIEDEDESYVASIHDPSASKLSIMRGVTREGRANSMGANSIATFTSVPFGARVHRASWSTRDFENMSEYHSRRNSTLMSPTQYNSMTPLVDLRPSPSSGSLARAATPKAMTVKDRQEPDDHIGSAV
ncbi:MAG: hypothetical protein M1817_003788 [Caeruleum heppii]|nr:MAG: hypothetical protein M1817_003788 [Caeruleum heppii]